MPFMPPEHHYESGFGVSTFMQLGSDPNSTAPSPQLSVGCDDNRIMIKRRDWVHMHGRDEDGTSDDDSSGASELTDAATSSGDSSVSRSSEDQAAETSSASSEGAEEIDNSRRLQDLSEDDFEANEEPEIDIALQYQQWMQAPSSQLLKGHPLKCKFCPDALLLNSTSLKQHLESKRHKKLQPKVYEDIAVCAANEQEDEESEGETHAERLDRLRQQSVPITALTSSQRRRQKRKLKAQSKQLRPAQKRCGKRQRAELKAQVFEQAGAPTQKAAGKGLPTGAAKLPVHVGKNKA